MEIKVRKFNEKTKAWDFETIPYDHRTLGVFYRPSSGTGNVVGALSVPSGFMAVVTAIKYIADSADTWFSVSGDYQDLHYLPAKGVDVVEGSPDAPVFVLDEGESAVFTVTNATASNYAVIPYGMLRAKAPRR